MVFFRPGSHVCRFCALLAVTGEIPVKSLYLLGSQRVFRALVAKLIEPQTIVNTETGETLNCRLLTLHSKGAKKSVRFYKGGLPVLDWLGAHAFYTAAFWGHRFPSDNTHVERNFRLAETAALFMLAGCEFRPWVLEPFQDRCIQRLAFPIPGFYSARSLKSVGEHDLKLAQYARFVGAVFTDQTGMVVYNARNAVMKWNGMSELKAKESLAEISRLNTAAREMREAILLAGSVDAAVRTIEATEKKHREEFRIDSIYPHVYCVPLNEEGARQLRFLLMPYRYERLMAALFDPAQRSYDRGDFEYDAIVNGAYMTVFLDGDIPRLIRLRNSISPDSYRCEILCFPHQVSLARHVLGDGFGIRTIELSEVESMLGLRGGTVFEPEA